MYLPLFSYSEHLLRQAEQCQVLMSESSVLLLHCSRKHHYLGRSDVLVALANFENWKQDFVNNCYKKFYEFAAFEHYEPVFLQIMTECLFFAELYSWNMYANVNLLNASSFVDWIDGRLVKTRLLSELVFSK